MKWACAISATNDKDGIRHHHIGAMTVEANSEDEAIGKAYRITEIVFPTIRGWCNHNLAVKNADILATPDTVAECRL